MKTRMNRRKKSRHPLVVVLIAAVCLAAISVLIIAPGWLGRSPETTTLYIPEGAGYDDVRDSLARHTSAEYADKVLKFAKIYKTDFSHRAGAYYIPKGFQAFRAAKRISRGEQTPVKIKINGFRDIDDLSRRIAAKFRFTPDDFSDYLNNPSRLHEAGHSSEHARVIFLDANYDFYWTDSEKKIIDRFEKQYADFWTPERRSQAETLGLSPDEIIIIASITDEETTRPEEKGRIGRLYINRLHKGMRLQADPTVKFALGDFSIKRVLQKHLYTKSPYNTYRFNGLPPGPIRTTSKATVDSILNSQPSDDLYMCAREDLSGTHVFSPTFDEHRSAAEKYRSKIDEIGL